MPGLCEDRVCIVTGAGGGIGREHALLLAAHGAKVVVNDLGATLEGDGTSTGPANDVVQEILAAGGEAVANTDDVSSWDGAQRLVQQTVDTYGRLDVLVNNAGILRDRMLVNMTEDEWDAVIRVHLKGTFATARHAAAHWRERTKAGEDVDARLINTTSVSGIYGNVGQTNYGAAKMGVAGFTIIAAEELGRYGVTVNAIAPGGLTRMSKLLGMGGVENLTDEQKESMSPRFAAPVCVWLASTQSTGITGRVFEATGATLAVAEGWHRGPSTEPIVDPAAIDPVARDLVARARPNADIHGQDRPAG
ncbi:MAG TPA: SDR family oxidoreductase [Acidimicrobiales bacterium]|nr:SDR family oxidoreductase [Acidimicrobiales bacterium]